MFAPAALNRKAMTGLVGLGQINMTVKGVEYNKIPYSNL